MVFCLLSNGGVVTSILSETLNLVFFYLRNLLYLIKLEISWNIYSHLYPREEERAVEI